jgi:hypothetical protein
MGLVLAVCGIEVLVAQQRPDAYIQFPGLNVPFPSSEQIAQAMTEDGLGRYIVMDEPSIDFLTVLRLANGTQWGFYFVTPHEVLGLTPIQLRATWVAAGDSAGRLVIEAPGLKTPCWFGGDILRDRVTVIGEAICGQNKTPFLARIPRDVKCKGFDGVWGGRGAPLTIAVAKDGRVTGTYANGGRLTGRTGELSRIAGEWSDATGSGRFQFATGDGDRSFSGSYWTPPDASRPKRWDGTCVGPRR